VRKHFVTWFLVLSVTAGIAAGDWTTQQIEDAIAALQAVEDALIWSEGDDDALYLNSIDWSLINGLADSEGSAYLFQIRELLSATGSGALADLKAATTQAAASQLAVATQAAANEWEYFQYTANWQAAVLGDGGEERGLAGLIKKARDQEALQQDLNLAVVPILPAIEDFAEANSLGLAETASLLRKGLLKLENDCYGDPYLKKIEEYAIAATQPSTRAWGNMASEGKAAMSQPGTGQLSNVTTRMTGSLTSVLPVESHTVASGNLGGGIRGVDFGPKVISIPLNRHDLVAALPGGLGAKIVLVLSAGFVAATLVCVWRFWAQIVSFFEKW